ncbi:ADP-heptose synthase [Alteromonas sp. RW2A1]|uniref:PfkB family carbohydrate kinase n=1 Tax=Alteromonas sp. RW2A1 TaxID=1917158 RepID=UPI000903B7FD|nr:PfkB family carbohydrate kinase [Alteromonas sp. RW2A1]APE06028.1 ADP-heptose synthase [Alteromonas sp. RW2A1]
MAKNILVTGNFDLLHPGHIRLLKFAKECGDHLLVAVNSDKAMAVESKIDEQHRLEMVRSIQYVDEAFLTDLSPADLISLHRPFAVVKGKEFEDKENPERQALRAYGGKLIFGSGEFDFSSEHFIKPIQNIGSNFDFSELKRYAKRHQIKLHDLLTTFKKMDKLNVAVVGEVIVDEYVQGKAVGLSQEDPTIVMTPNQTDTFLGGAAITAGHIKSIGANRVTLFSVLGADTKSEYVKSRVHDYDISSFLIEDSSRPTPLKTRYRADTKTLLRVNQVRHHKISEELQASLLAGIMGILDDINVLVFSDFNYGLLPQSLVNQISKACEEKGVRYVADSQTSSQVGDISRYRDTFLMTPTEKEVRVALNNADDGLVILAKKLCEKSNPQNLVITLAADGVLIHIPGIGPNEWQNDRIPAINKNAADPAGAGDCFLAASSLAMIAGASAWEAFYIASIASACQVGTIGNKPLQQSLLLRLLRESFE